MPRFQAIFQAVFAVPLLLASVSLAVTPVKVPPNGKGYGFISNTNNLGKVYLPPTGDWITTTFCYCHPPVRQPQDWRYGKAHVFQYEYYNYHSNVTFVAEHLCVARAPHEGDRCIRPNIDRDNMDWYIKNGKGGYLCKDFERTEEEIIRQANSKRGISNAKRNLPHFKSGGICAQWNCDKGPFEDPKEESFHPKHDELCFGVAMNFYGSGELEIKFNGQKRTMKGKKQAGRLKSDYYEVMDMCEERCQREFQMPVDMEIMDPRAMGGSRQFIYPDVDDMCDHCK